MPITWDSGMNQRILLFVIDDKSTTVDWAGLAEFLSTDDDKCTVTAVQKHISRLHVNMAKGTAEGPSTPAGKMTKNPATPKTPATKGKGGKRKRAPVVSDSDDEANARSPRKRPKPEPTDDEKSKKVKAESTEDTSI